MPKSMLEVSIQDKKKIQVEKRKNQFFVEKEAKNFTVRKVATDFIKIIFNKKIYNVRLIDKNKAEVSLSLDGTNYCITIHDRMEQILKDLGMNALNTVKINEIKAPMPGTILGLTVTEGEKVEKGSQLLILEAMKMENVIKSPGEGIIDKILISKGDNVEKNEVLISFK